MPDSAQERKTESLARKSTCAISKNAEHAFLNLLILVVQLRCTLDFQGNAYVLNSGARRAKKS